MGLGNFLRSTLAGATVATSIACSPAITTSTQTFVNNNKDTVYVSLTPHVVLRNEPAQLRVVAPGADRIRVWRKKEMYDTRVRRETDRLVTSIDALFGDDSLPPAFAPKQEVEINGVKRHIAFDIVRKPYTIEVCRQTGCDTYEAELPIKVEKANDRKSALIVGTQATLLARRFSGHDTVFTKGTKVMPSFVASYARSTKQLFVRVEAEHSPNYFNRFTLDIGRALELKEDDRAGLGLGFLLNVYQNNWQLPSPSLRCNTNSYFMAGPAYVSKGLLAGSYFGLEVCGGKVTQAIGSRIVFDGNLSSAKMPIHLAVNKLFALNKGIFAPLEYRGQNEMVLGFTPVDRVILSFTLATQSNVRLKDDYRLIYTQAPYKVGALFVF